MIAAGSVAAAVQGLYLKGADSSLSSQNLTNYLSQVIRSDPVSPTLPVFFLLTICLSGKLKSDPKSFLFLP